MRGDQPVVSAASWMVSAPSTPVSVANLDTVVSRFVFVSYSGAMGRLSRMPLMNSLMKFARSRKGRRMAAAAMAYAQTPKGRRQIAQAREQLARRRRPR